MQLDVSHLIVFINRKRWVRCHSFGFSNHALWMENFNIGMKIDSINETCFYLKSKCQTKQIYQRLILRWRKLPSPLRISILVCESFSKHIFFSPPKETYLLLSDKEERRHLSKTRAHRIVGEKLGIKSKVLRNHVRMLYVGPRMVDLLCKY